MKSKILRKLEINKVTISSIKGGITDKDIDSEGRSSNCVRETSNCPNTGHTMTSAGRSLGCAVGN